MKGYGAEGRFTFEILGLQILFLTLSFKKVKKSAIPPAVMAIIRDRTNSIKSYKDVKTSTSEDILFLNIVTLLMYTFKYMTSVFDVESIIKTSSKMLKSEEDAVYHKVLINMLAVLMYQGVVNEAQKDEMKSSLNVTFMDILSVNCSQLPRELWHGIEHNPLENMYFIEYWKEALLKEQGQVVNCIDLDIPHLPKGLGSSQNISISIFVL